MVRWAKRRRVRAEADASITAYGIGQRVVQFVLDAEGHARWVCNCDRYRESLHATQGPWCKHVAKAAAIRSIERLTGERVISRPTAYPEP
ncbi:MAG TPA: hypothetical protein VMU67_13705 [Steroidobacteraceae bacterium]|nr:hypothetical protein [Steroidobacteraceae bacterium]